LKDMTSECNHSNVLSLRGAVLSGLGAVLLAGATAWVGGARAEDVPLGLFSGQVDVGAPEKAGSGNYDATSGRYILHGSGANMWGAHDEFHFVWRKVQGDFVLKARLVLSGPGVEAHRKAGLMVRASLDTAAPYVDGVIHGSGPAMLQSRPGIGADGKMMPMGIPDADFVQIERRGDTYVVSASKQGGPFERRELAQVELGKEVYVGLFVCAHNGQVVEEADFWDVQLVVPGQPGASR
jgi:regulation of enolase protein 1 (concanavalin A-like superfamily)